MGAYEFSLEDIRGIVGAEMSSIHGKMDNFKEQLNDVKKDVDCLYTHVDAIKSAVNPKMEKYGLKLIEIEGRLKNHEEYHIAAYKQLQEKEKQDLEKGSFVISKKAFNLQKTMVIGVLIFNTITLAFTIYTVLSKKATTNNTYNSGSQARNVSYGNESDARDTSNITNNNIKPVPNVLDLRK